MKIIKMKVKYSLTLLLSILLLNCSKDYREQQSLSETTETVYTLPIVVHIVHVGESVGIGYNLSKERIYDQINTLNNDFRKKEGTLGYNTHILGADAKIEFKLAKIDPNGNPTEGITRVNFQDVTIDVENDWFFDDLPYYGYWNKQEYINIWVFPLDGVLGQSSVPYINIPGLENANPNGTTGILITTAYFGTTNTINNLNLGRTLTHEMGHFLGLEHLWGKTENANCMEFDDYCNDTPLVSRRTENCDNIQNSSCNGEFALTQNYMDYTSDACMNMFTKDQVARMQYVLKNSTVRSSLITSLAINRD